MAQCVGEVGAMFHPSRSLLWCNRTSTAAELRTAAGTRSCADLVERGAQAYLMRYEIKGVSETTMYPGIDAMLHGIRSAGSARVCCRTTKIRRSRRGSTGSHFSLREHFDGVFGARRDGSPWRTSGLLRHHHQRDRHRSGAVGDDRRSRARHRRRESERHRDHRRHLRIPARARS